MNQEEITDIFNEFANQTALVIGDVMVDAYYWGKVNRISPEAPVPVVSVTSKEHRLGGAANVALNIAALGAKPLLCSVIGTDEKGVVFQDLMKGKELSTDYLLQVEERETTTKTRIISGNQQVVRVDEETESPINDDLTSRLLLLVKKAIVNDIVDVIIIEDYNKGLLTEKFITEVISIAKEKGVPIAVDPKQKNFFSYGGASLFKPNLKELKEGLKTDADLKNVDELKKAVEKLLQKMPAKNVLVTLSEKGVCITNSKELHTLPAHIRNIADVSGAGDTVISVAALCLAQELPLKTIAGLANLAGGLVCEKVGVVPINKEELKAEAGKL